MHYNNLIHSRSHSLGIRIINTIALLKQNILRRASHILKHWRSIRLLKQLGHHSRRIPVDTYTGYSVITNVGTIVPMY